MGQEVLKEIRTFSYLLHPPLLEQVGLEAALDWYVEGFSTRSSIAVDLVVHLGSIRLPSEIETALFRVVQESLTNVHRHSGTESASIRLVREGDLIVLEVKDEGGEVTPGGSILRNNTAPMGVGIAGMRERMRQLGGELKITSDAIGTTITAVIGLGGELIRD